MIFEEAANSVAGTSDFFLWNGISSEGEAAPPGIYVGLIEIFNLEGDIQHFKLPFVIAMKW